MKGCNVLHIEHKLDRSLVELLRFACLVKQQVRSAIFRDQFGQPVGWCPDGFETKEECLERGTDIHVSYVKDDAMEAGGNRGLDTPRTGLLGFVHFLSSPCVKAIEGSDECSTFSPGTVTH